MKGTNHMSQATTGVYDESSIQVLEGLAHVRKRPAMYVGDTAKRGLHHLIWEVLDNAVDEAMGGHCTQINISIEADGRTISIEDNGRGIPVKEHATQKKSTLEVVLTVLGAGGKFGGSGYEASGGLHGVGVSCVNALSETLTARVWRDGGEWVQNFRQGVPVDACTKVKESRKHGTQITWLPDTEIFTYGIDLDEDTIVRRIRETAFLNANLQINFHSKHTGRHESFCYSGGIADYVTYLNEAHTHRYPATPFSCEKRQGTTMIQVAMQYHEDDDLTLLTFANNIQTIEGGTHLSGFKKAHTRVLNQFARSTGKLKERDANLAGDDLREGLTAIVSVRLPQPQFEGQTKSKLGTQEIEGVMEVLFGEALTDYCERNPEIVKVIIDRAKIAAEARAKAKEVAKSIKRQSFLGRSNSLPGKLKDCSLDDANVTELIIVEGDSAAGTAKDGRDPRTQAILPIRGKIINAEKHGLHQLLGNEEVQAIIAAVGTGVDLGTDDSEFRLEDRRYDKVIILSDADIDGSHIAALLLTFFYRFMRPLVMGGHVYLAMAPLYKVESGKNKTYCWTEEEMTSALKKTSGKGKVTRFKGLGEMDAEELGETTMQRGNRRLMRITVSDLAEASHMTSVLMGTDTAPRKAHLVQKSKARVASTYI